MSEPAATAAPPRRRGMQGTVTDMVLSLGVVLLLIGVVALVTIRPSGPADGVREISYATQLADARAAAPYEILAPDGLAGYRATSVRYTVEEDGSIGWHLGFVSPADRYLGLDQTDGDGDAFAEVLTDGAAPTGSRQVMLGDRLWTRLDGGNADAGDPTQVRRGLRHDADGVTTLVAGTATWRELEAFAASLSGGDHVDLP